MEKYILQDGSEVELDISGLPEISDFIQYKITYRDFDPNFKRWFDLQKARYVKACYRALREARDPDEFELMIMEASNNFATTKAWKNYIIDSRPEPPKRSVGRPKLPEHLKKRPRRKRSDEMRELLESHGFVVEKGCVRDSSGNQWRFLPNGKVETPEGHRISAHQFINSYGL